MRASGARILTASPSHVMKEAGLERPSSCLQFLFGRRLAVAAVPLGCSSLQGPHVNGQPSLLLPPPSPPSPRWRKRRSGNRLTRTSN